MKLRHACVGAVSATILILNTAVYLVPFIALTLLKILCQPIKGLRVNISKALAKTAELWMATNILLLEPIFKPDWEVQIDQPLSKEHWYLIISNHCSWVDIIVIFYALNGKVPYLRFFLKDTLFWIPVLGLTWWALDYPFMKRFSHSYLRKHPEKKGTDFQTTQRACEKYKDLPISVLNFVEGTRFSEIKHQKQHSPYQHLLKPKSGGVAHTIQIMGRQFNAMLDITILYGNNNTALKTRWIPSFSDLLAGRAKKARIEIRLQKLPEQILTLDSANKKEDRVIFNKWLNDIWQAKDNKIKEYLEKQ